MNSLERRIFLYRYKFGHLKPGKVKKEIFEALVILSKINSQKVIYALSDYLVTGLSRKESCIKNNLSMGYFSISLKKINDTNNCVSGIVHYYQDMFIEEQ